MRWHKIYQMFNTFVESNNILTDIQYEFKCMESRRTCYISLQGASGDRPNSQVRSDALDWNTSSRFFKTAFLQLMEIWYLFWCSLAVSIYLPNSSIAFKVPDEIQSELLRDLPSLVAFIYTDIYLLLHIAACDSNFLLHFRNQEIRKMFVNGRKQGKSRRPLPLREGESEIADIVKKMFLKKSHQYSLRYFF